MPNQTLDYTKLLGGTEHRLTLQASLTPTSGLDRFQPAGFPEIGHVIYDAPRGGSVRKVCIVDSAASMANHLEMVCLESERSLELVGDLRGMPYVECRTDEGWPEVTRRGPHRLVVTTLSEGHRLASSYFLDGLLVENGEPGNRKFLDVLRAEFGIADLGNRSHPLPEQWWDVFTTIFRYDPNSLVHGILFPALGIKLPRLLTAHLEAFDAARVGSSGVKFDKIGKTTSGQPIFAVDQEVASEIIATFVIDLSLLRSFGRNDHGLNNNQKQLLLSLALWKIGRLLQAPFRYRSNCDLELQRLRIHRNARENELAEIELPSVDVATAIENAGFQSPQVSQVYWRAEDLFRAGEDEALADSPPRDKESEAEEQ